MSSAPMRVAIVGCGVGGLGAAYALASSSPHAALTLYEARGVLGGHANTVMVDGRPVDTGFLVYNEEAYPNLCGLFEELGVPTEPTEMSFAVSLAARTLEWSSNGLNGLFGQRRNAASPAFLSMIRDILRFNAAAPALLAEPAGSARSTQSMGDFLKEGGYSASFIHWYLVPQVAAVWSASASGVLDFPARTLIQFFVNHSLLTAVERPQWRTVSRRSREYVRRLSSALPPSRTTIRLNTRVVSVTRAKTGGMNGGESVTITDASGASEIFDAVIFGAHPDEVLAMLGSNATAEERAALGGFKYAPNEAYLHSDDAFMPSRKRVWASWNYMGKGSSDGDSKGDSEACCVTYWLNRLQNFPSSMRDLFVTLNPSPTHLPAPEKVLQKLSYSHPQYTATSIAAQGALGRLQGVTRTFYAGAYLGYGFHEDGLSSGLRAGVSAGGGRPRWWSSPMYTLPTAALEAAAAEDAAAAAPSKSGSAGERAPLVGAALSAAEEASTALLAIASGGPFWHDNLGNGGPVGIATRAVVALVARTRQTHAEMVLEAKKVKCAPSSPSGVKSRGAASTPSPSPSTGALTAEDFFGTNTRNDISGYLVQGPDDVIAVYEAMMRDEEEAGGGGKGGGEEGKGRIDKGTGGVEFLDRVCAKSQESGGALAVSARVALALRGRRTFKDRAVGEALAAEFSATLLAASHSASGARTTGTPRLVSRSALLSTPVGVRMDAQTGGYTGQPIPLRTQLAGAEPSLFGWAWRSGTTLVKHMAITPVLSFLSSAIVEGAIILRTPDGHERVFGDPSAEYPLRARIRVHSWTFFARVAAQSDLGLARSFIAGDWSCDDLTALFRVFITNRDKASLSTFGLWTAWLGMTLNFATYALKLDNSISNARANISSHYDLSNDLFSSFLDGATMMYSCGFFKPSRRVLVDVDLPTRGAAPPLAGQTTRATRSRAVQAVTAAVPMPLKGDTSPSAGPTAANAAIAASGRSVAKVVKAAYTTPIVAPPSATTAAPPARRAELVFGGSLEEAQTRKLDHLIARAQISATDRVLDLGFGWGGFSIRLAQTVGCRVHGITLSKEQCALAQERVNASGVAHLITFEIIDYRVFAAAHPGEFDRIIAIEMVEAVGHNYFGAFLGALDRLLAPNGVIVLQAITMPEGRYAEYLRTTDFINTIIFPGGCCPSLAALTDAMMKNTTLMLNTVDQFNLHYGETLRRWRANFNALAPSVVSHLGFTSAFIRQMNYYFCYCEAGFSTQTLGLQVLTFTRPSNAGLIAARPPAGALAGEQLGEWEGEDVSVPTGVV